MPHVSDIRAMSPDHDRHDPMVVAALAAGDLSGTDRDHALQLTRSCPSCAELHDDLVAIARATAAVPPPVSARPRDFQLTAADAARLRPAGWGRLGGAVGGISRLFNRPLGVGLATLGLVGLLIGNVSLPMGTASSPGGGSAAQSESPTGLQDLAAPAASAAAAAASAAASAGAAAVEPVPAASGNTEFSTNAGGAASPSSLPDAVAVRPSPSSAAIRGAATDGSSKTGVVAASSPALAPREVSPAPAPFRPLDILFVASILAGLAILVGDRLRRRAAG